MSSSSQTPSKSAGKVAKASAKTAPATGAAKTAKATKPAKPTKARKPATAPRVAAVAKRKSAAKPASQPRTVNKASKPAKPPAPAAEPTKPAKTKLVRDSFTMPKPEYLVIDALKQRGAQAGRPLKKSEVLRAGVKALAAMADAEFAAVIASVQALKTGRPKSRKSAEPESQE